MAKKNVHIALLLMMKNEEKRIHVTLNSVLNQVDSIVAFDTGSTDNTIKILTEFCIEHKIPLHLKEGEFVNFSESRNVSLLFADEFPEIDYLLLLDVNDELRGGDKLREFAIKHSESPSTGFLVCQEWWSGSYDKYFNLRLVKAREGWRYRGRVHEFMKNTKFEDGKEPQVLRVPDSVVLFQDRTQDNNKSGPRFARDKVLLLEDFKENPTEPRTVFYLAQTCSCLNELEDAFYYYKIRSTLEGFQEEKYHAFQRAGEISEKLGHSWYDSMSWYIKSFEHSKRAEPLINIAKHYLNSKEWLLAYAFINLACGLEYPDHLILFVDKRAYEYTRWHLMSIIASHLGHNEQGKNACLKALEIHKLDTDKNILEYYEKIEAENWAKAKGVTKKQFIEQQFKIIKENNPSLKPKQIHARANKEWKNRLKN